MPYFLSIKAKYKLFAMILLTLAFCGYYQRYWC